MKKTDDWKENIKRIANLIVGGDKDVRVICVTEMNESLIAKNIGNVLANSIEEWGRKVHVIDITAEQNVTGAYIDKIAKELPILKTKYDYIIINDLCIAKYSLGIAAASLADKTILLIEKGTINGNKAMELKRELDMNDVDILGSVFIK